MRDRDWFDDFMDYKLSRCEENNKTSDNNGCLPCIWGVLLLLVVRSLFG